MKILQVLLLSTLIVLALGLLPELKYRLFDDLEHFKWYQYDKATDQMVRLSGYDKYSKNIQLKGYYKEGCIGSTLLELVHTYDITEESNELTHLIELTNVMLKSKNYVGPTYSGSRRVGNRMQPLTVIIFGTKDYSLIDGLTFRRMDNTIKDLVCPILDLEQSMVLYSDRHKCDVGGPCKLPEQHMPFGLVKSIINVGGGIPCNIADECCNIIHERGETTGLYVSLFGFLFGDFVFDPNDNDIRSKPSKHTYTHTKKSEIG